MLVEIVILALGNILIVSVLALGLKYVFKRISVLWIALIASILTTTVIYSVALALINWRDKPFIDKLRASLFESPAAQALAGSVVIGFAGALLMLRMLNRWQMRRKRNYQMNQ
jgi:hypothetical protein